MSKIKLKSKYCHCLQRFFNTCFLSLFFIMGLAGIASVQARDTIIAGIPANFPPHYFVKNEKPYGFGIDVMDEVAKRADLTVSYLVYPTWQEVITAMQQGTIDIIPNMGITKDRLKFMDFTSPLETFSLSICIRKSSTSVHNQSDLAGRRVGAVKTNAAKKLLEKRDDIELVLFNSPEEALVGLLTADIDALAYPAPVLMRLAYATQIDASIKELPQPLAEIKRAIAIRLDRPELLKRLNTALASYINSPAYIEIYKKWYGSPAPFWSTKKVLLFMGGMLLLVSAIFLGLHYFRLWTLNKGLLSLLKKYQLTKDALMESEEQYRELIEGTDNIVLRSDAETRIRFLNPKAEDVFGLPAEKCISRSMFDFVHPEDRELTQKTIEKWLAEKKSMLIFENRQVSRHGEIRTILWTINFHYGDNAKLISINSIGTDLTAIRKEENKLLERDEKVKNVLRLTNTGVWSIDLLTNKAVWSDEIFRLLGYEQGSVTPSYENWLARVHPDFREKAKNMYREGIREGNKTFFEYKLLLPGGSVRWMRNVGWINRDSSGKTVNISGLEMDITEHKLSQEKLALSQSQLKLLLDSTAEGIYGVDLNGNCTLVNRACITMLGYAKKEELLGKNMHSLIHHTKKDGAAFPAGECRINNQATNYQGSHSDDEIMWRKDGTSFEAEYWSYPIIVEEKCIGAVVTFFDITWRKKNERTLRDHHDHLEEVVTERTAELKRIVNLMAGREIRMAEMKKQIVALKSQLEKANLTQDAAESKAQKQ